MMLMRFALMTATFLLLGTQGFAAGGFKKLDPVPSPPLVLQELAGAERSLHDFKRKVILVNFWASWCPPCRREMPSMQRLKEKMSGRPFVILGVDSAEPREEVEAFLKMVKVDFHILLDPDSQATRRWKVFVLPTSFLIDRDGNVRYSLSGPTEWDAGEATQIIELLLQEK